MLLAEDSPDNQILISTFLEKCGAEVEVGCNGEEAVRMALEAVTAGTPFDVILMDMHMPILDGYEATRQLRSSGYARPIIALTANAMRGDELNCREAGCDDYAVKPIDRRKLISQIRAQLKRVGVTLSDDEPDPQSVAGDAPRRSDPRDRPAAEQVTEGRRTDAGDEPLDQQIALDRAGGDEHILRELADLFLELAPGWMDEIETAMRSGDWTALRRAAHTLKNGADNIGAQPAQEAAYRLEQLAADRREDGLSQSFDDVRRQIDRLLPAIKEWSVNCVQNAFH
jgi:CheY-like chemotaxis protein